MHLDEILIKLKNIKKQGSGYTSQCPGHADNKNSLSVSEGKDGTILLFCHAGCLTEKILDSMGLKLSDLYSKKERNIAAEYLYKDILGNVIHKTIRFEPKGFTQCRPDGKGSWIYNLKGINPIIYNLKRVITAISENETIYIVEGEKDVDNLEKVGLVATTSPMGAGKWQSDYSDYLADSIAVIIPDNDTVGKSHAEQIAKSLSGKAKSIKVIDLTKGAELPPKGDVTNFFKQLGKAQGIESLKRIVNSTDLWDPQTKEDPWVQPLPFETFNLPPFPTDSFPDWIREYIESVAENTQTPEDMTAVMVLAICSIPCNKIYKVEGGSDWQEPTNLYCAIIAKPAERKSAIMTHISKPIREYETDENSRLKDNISSNQADKKILEGVVEKLKNMAVKNDDALSIAIARDKAVELSQFEDIRQVRFTCDDVTPEKLVGLLVDNKGKMSIVSAEGGIFGTMAGRYSEKVNIDVFLKAHAGDSLRVDRIGRPSEYIENPSLSMALAVQPYVLTGIMQNENFKGRGLTARFLYSIPTSKVGSRDIECKPIPQNILNIYHRNIKTLLAVKVPEYPYILKLSKDAYKLSIEFATSLEPRLIDDLESIGEWAGKLRGAILRISGVLHVAEHVGQNASEQTISATTYSHALLMGQYFLEHAKAAFSLMGADKNIEDCKYVLRWIKKQGQTELKKRDILRGNQRFKKVDELEPVIKLLCEYEYLKESEQIKEKPGRNPDKIYKVNPLISQTIGNDYTDFTDYGKQKNESNHSSQDSQQHPQAKQINNDYDFDWDSLRNGGELVI